MINTDLLVSLIFILYFFFGCVRLCARFAVSLTELISFLSLISRYISYTDLKMEAQKRLGSQRACFLATRFSQYGKLTVLWTESQMLCVVCGGGGGVVKGERKEKVKRGRGWERDEANERVIPKHLRKHFPLSYHLDVVSGTRTANVFPLSTPPTFSCFWLFRKGKGTLGLYFFFPAHWHKAKL